MDLKLVITSKVIYNNCGYRWWAMDNASEILKNINKLQEKLENNYLKTITIMFTDLKDSTKYFEKHGDIKGRLFIERHNKMLFPIIEAHNGVIIKTIGDSIMAKFDSEYLGVRASVEMQKRLDDYNQTADEKIRIRIGIHTGKAIVENNDIFGDAVNVAARIESDTAPGRTTISETTLNGIKRYPEIKIRPLGKVKFKGKSDEIETYSVLWRTTILKDSIKNIKTVKNSINKKEVNKPSDISKAETQGIASQQVSRPNGEKKQKISEIFKNRRNQVLLITTGILAVILLIAFFLSDSNKKKPNRQTELSSDRKQIKEYAESFINKKIPKSQKWNNSLSGFVKMVYLYFDIDLTNTNPKNPNGSWKNTTELIYSFVRENGELFKIGPPKAGDFIFFDNTWDKNKNNKFDDMLTTVGLVTGTDEEGTVYFLYKVGNTIRIRNMNLKHPNKSNIKNKNIIKILNSKIRKLSKKDRENNIPALASQLFNTYGRLLDTTSKNGSKKTIEDFKLYKTLGNHQRKPLVEYAMSFKDKKLPKSKLWTNSSSGFIKMVFLKFKVNITKSMKTKDKNGKWLSMTKLIFHFVKENGRLYKNKDYQIGDLIFFDNTYDKNKDGKFNDKLTSIGLITNIDKDKTISFLINISGKISLKYINLIKKENKIKIRDKEKIINSTLRFFKKDKIYSYQLFNKFGSVFR